MAKRAHGEGSMYRAADGYWHGSINLGSGRPVSVRSLVTAWIAQNGWNITPKYGELPYPDYEPMAFWGDPGGELL